MKLTVLGSSGSVPGPASAASGYLVEADGFRVVLDLGHGAFGQLQRYVDPSRVNAVIISHLHADHFIDMTAYITALRYGSAGWRADPERRIVLIGPGGIRDRLEAANDPLVRKQRLGDLFRFEKHADGELGPFRVSYLPMRHSVPTVGIRLEADGVSLAYSGDTGETDELTRLAEGASTLLCEATVAPDQIIEPNIHLTGRQAGAYATRAGVGRLLVTHVPPWNSGEVEVAEASGTYSGKVDLAVQGAEYEI